MQDQNKNKGVLSSILTELGILSPARRSTDSVATDQRDNASSYPSDRVPEDDLSQNPSVGPCPTQHRR